MEKLRYIPHKYQQRIYIYNSRFAEYLRILCPMAANQIINDYRLGGTVDGRTIFWEIDFCNNIRTGKIISYKPDGHRNKAVAPQWVHTQLINNKVLPSTFKVNQCMFGEHLLHEHPGAPVALVEAEKTAVICAALDPDYVWVAVGGLAGLSADRCKALRCRRVIVFPDTDAEGKTFKQWAEISRQQLRHITQSITVSDLLERVATKEQKSKKIDIADLLTQQILKKDG